MTAPEARPAAGPGSHDQPLIDAFLRGDAAAYTEVGGWIRIAALPFASLLRAGLEDLQQDLLLELDRSLRSKRFRGDSTLRTYVRRMAQHHCIDRLRAARRRTWLDLSTLDLPAREEAPDQRLERRQSLRVALRVFAAAPAGCRELWRRILDGESYRQMSAALGVAEGTLRVRVARCRSAAVEARRSALRGNEPPAAATGSVERRSPHGV